MFSKAAIKATKRLERREFLDRIEIKANAPEANIFYLIGITRENIKQLINCGLAKESELKTMRDEIDKSGSYDKAIEVLNNHRKHHFLKEIKIIN